jgi:hypothetical protein
MPEAPGIINRQQMTQVSASEASSPKATMS